MSNSIFGFGRKTLLMFGAVLLFAATGFVAESANAQRVIRATNGAANPGQTVSINIQLVAQGNESSTSFSFTYNPLILTNPQVTLGNGVPLNSNLGTNTSQVAQGNYGVLVDSTNAYAAGTQNILNVTFTIAPGAQLGLTPVGFSSTPTAQSVSSTTGALLPTTYTAGTIQVGSTAAGVEVSGRVVTPEGRGIRNARVILTDSTGAQRVVTTSSFGIYRFSDVESGGTYVFSVASKQYRFTPRVVQIVDSLTDFDFIGQQ
jgi:hypothetical protein